MSCHVVDRSAVLEAGFSLIELIITLAVVLLVAGVLAAAARPAREAFDRVPAELDLQQRARVAMDAIAAQVRSSLRADVRGAALTTIAKAVAGGQGTLSADQANRMAPLVLSPVACPNIRDVCGFTSGATAMVSDDSGNAEVFAVAGVSVTGRSITPVVLSRPWPKGALVQVVEQYTFTLSLQSDGSRSLVRQTYAGAVQPLVDDVSALSFAAHDGRIDVSFRVHPVAGLPIPSKVFTSSILRRNAP